MRARQADELVGQLTAVEMGDGRSVLKNNVVLLAYRQPQTGAISVRPMLVQKLSVHQERPAYQLSSLNGDHVVHGNSGGGLFMDGQLVANMWETVLERQVLRATGEVVSDKMQTDLSLAAQLPLSIAAQ